MLSVCIRGFLPGKAPFVKARTRGTSRDFGTAALGLSVVRAAVRIPTWALSFLQANPRPKQTYESVKAMQPFDRLF